MKSVFYWQGNLDHSKEHSMLAQTTRDQSSAIQQLLSENHSYDFLCLLALPILWGNREFLNWIKEETYPQESIG
jgi:periplasmic divalent cation tolerance protein